MNDSAYFFRATIVSMAILTAMCAVCFAVFGRAELVPGLLLGASVGAVDAIVLLRGVRRFVESAPLRPSSGSFFIRFLTVGAVLGVVMVRSGLNPISIVMGFLMFPVSITLAGVGPYRRRLGIASHAR